MVEPTHILFNYILLAEPLSDKLVQWVIMSHNIPSTHGTNKPGHYYIDL